MSTTNSIIAARSSLEVFEASLGAGCPPADLDPALAALWWAHRGAWDRAHRLVQDESGRDAAWVHAWLHRAEGDLGNAGYWYRRAGRPVGSSSLDDEWRVIATTLLAEQRRETTDDE